MGYFLRLCFGDVKNNCFGYFGRPYGNDYVYVPDCGVCFCGPYMIIVGGYILKVIDVAKGVPIIYAAAFRRADAQGHRLQGEAPAGKRTPVPDRGPRFMLVSPDRADDTQRPTRPARVTTPPG